MDKAGRPKAPDGTKRQPTTLMLNQVEKEFLKEMGWDLHMSRAEIMRRGMLLVAQEKDYYLIKAWDGYRLDYDKLKALRSQEWKKNAQTQS